MTGAENVTIIYVSPKTIQVENLTIVDVSSAVIVNASGKNNNVYLAFRNLRLYVVLKYLFRQLTRLLESIDNSLERAITRRHS